MKELFEYNLKTPIKISKNGDYVKELDVVVHTPSPAMLTPKAYMDSNGVIYIKFEGSQAVTA